MYICIDLGYLTSNLRNGTGNRSMLIGGILPSQIKADTQNKS
jgi:hypothetical protein